LPDLAPPRSQHMDRPALMIMMFDLSLLLNLNFLNTAPVNHPVFLFPYLAFPSLSSPHLPALSREFSRTMPIRGLPGRSGKPAKFIYYNYKRRI
jgi:hypothetical protein